MDRRLGECCDGSNVWGINTKINIRLSGKRERVQGLQFASRVTNSEGPEDAVAQKYPGCHARQMKRTTLWAIVVPVLACSLTVAAQEKGIWRAASSTAQSITGDVSLSDEKISINYAGFVIARIRGLEQGEVSAVFDVDSGAGGSGSLYRVSIPASKKFMHKNTLCGAEDAQWMATYVAGRSLHLAFFSGEKVPVLTLDAVSNSTDLCGTFAYVR